MPGLPTTLLTHRMTVELYLGASATGPIYGPPVVVPCFVEPGRQSQRAPGERTPTGTATIYTQLGEQITPESRVTVEGRQVEVVEVIRHDGGGLPTPDHLEIRVQ